ncbi:NADP-dependent oxidoreductase domain-containing protein [Cokeromyces recurvatus]|uniref:NADP-dependent oxidoreductase domain-containing protein n=1 Tax=Cokeromyces recurvatus TaxID=90255 RepID=UPI0022210E62|nr:NADP-dependent oxidoreductase domain-containing protein [Cokeromyces recurvatus]KAI7905487.1 NADP-dependent oxidoreductase domain-containing protein [Cokeromyces recurvatus]
MNQLLKNVIPKTGQQVTRLGFGSYRISKPNHAEALTAAIEGGINIIDTGNNFENGSSEILIGNTLDSLIKKKKISRESITLVTKSGYLGINDVKSFENNQDDYIQLSEKMFHSISPRVIESQIQTSLKRLKTDKIDIFMINSPERMLMAKNKRYTSSRLYKDLSESFRYLDSLVSQGIISGYGVCSNTMAFPTAADHVSLSNIIQSCQNPSNLVAIQVPFNLYEREAIIATTNDYKVKTVAEIAKENGIYVMTNRPLNAIANGQVRVLVNHELGKETAEQMIMSKMQTSFGRVAELESDIMSELPIEEEALTSKFVWGQVLSENLARLAQNHFATRHYLTNQVLPELEKDLKDLQNYAKYQLDGSSSDGLSAYEQWIEKYKTCVYDLTNSIVDYAYIDTLRKNNELDRILNALCPSLNQLPEDGYAHSPLSIKLLRLLLSHHNHVGTVFTGMRDPLYVKDALFAAQQRPIDQEDLDDIWQCPIFN